MYLAKELTQRVCPRSASSSAAAITQPCCTPCEDWRERAKNTELNHALHVLEQTLKG